MTIFVFPFKVMRNALPSYSDSAAKDVSQRSKTSTRVSVCVCEAAPFHGIRGCRWQMHKWPVTQHHITTGQEAAKSRSYAWNSDSKKL